MHNSTTVRHSSIRLILSLAVTYRLRVWTHDISQAYLQSSHALTRSIYLHPPAELGLPAGTVPRLLKPIYGLADSGDYWNRTMTTHLHEDLSMESTSGDMSLFYKRDPSSLCGLVGTYVDDTLSAGSSKFLEESERTSRRFESKSRSFKYLKFAELHIVQLDNSFC